MEDLSRFQKKLLDAAVQLIPAPTKGDTDDISRLCSYLWDYMTENAGFRLYPLAMCFIDEDLRSDSIEYAQIAYEHGYDAVLNDGKCFGYVDYRKMPS